VFSTGEITGIAADLPLRQKKHNVIWNLPLCIRKHNGGNGLRSGDLLHCLNSS